MNAKIITVKNIENNGYFTGDSIKGKGLEVFTFNRIGFVFNNIDHNQKELDMMIKTFKENKDETLFISSFRADGEEFECGPTLKDIILFSKKYDIKKMKKNNFEGFTNVVVKVIPKLIGYLGISKYKSNLESQKVMLKNLLALDNRKTVGSFEENNYCFDDSEYMEFSNTSNGTRINGDYEQNHGCSTYVQKKEDCICVNGRLNNFNSTVNENFCCDFDECYSSYLDEVDPDDVVSVYNRKGKDWYIGYTFDQEEFYLSYVEDGEFIKNEYFTALCFKENQELLKEIEIIIKGWKENQEVLGFIYNEFEEDSTHSKIMNLNLVNLIFECTDDFRNTIIDSIKDWKEKTIKEEFRAIYEKEIMLNCKVDKDLKVEIIRIAESFENKSDKKFFYNHLKILKALEKKFDYEIVYTKISEFNETCSFAFKKYEEEYHFDIYEVIADDLEEILSLRDLISIALAALADRKIKTISEKELIENSMKVFVGLEDSLKSGNCEFGTKEFASKHRIDMKNIGGIRGDILLNLENSSFTKRAVIFAIANHVA